MQNNSWDFFFFFPTKKEGACQSHQNAFVLKTGLSNKTKSGRKNERGSSDEHGVHPSSPSSPRPVGPESRPGTARAQPHEPRLHQSLHPALSLLGHTRPRFIYCATVTFAAAYSALPNSNLPPEFPRAGKHSPWGLRMFCLSIFEAILIARLKLHWLSLSTKTQLSALHRLAEGQGSQAGKPKIQESLSVY